jgi:hypothetical protein
LLTGTVPFKRDDPLQVLFAHVYDKAPRLTQLRPGLPRAADDVLARALAKDPADRYHSCASFANALRGALGVKPYEGDGSTEEPPSVPTIPPTTATRVLSTQDLSAPDLPAVPQADLAAAEQTQTEEGPSAATGTWTLLATADRAYYESLVPLDAADADSISFPGLVPERRFTLSGSEARIGRRSSSQGTPEIDLTGPPTDPGVSRLHAKLVSDSDGTWSVTDLGRANGIQVNGSDVPAGGTVKLRPGDRIHLGAWTQLTIFRD